IWASVTPPYSFRSIMRQINFIGARSLFVIVFTGLFTGMVLGLQGYHLLSKYGSIGALGAAVGNGLVRELGPVMTALMVIGRAGSAMCAEVGIMRNSEQLDALECMAIDPIKYLLAPKYIATIFSVFLLSFVFDASGIIGGYFVGVSLSDVSIGSYFQGMYDSVNFDDLRMGMYKALVFGLLTVWIATAKGFFVHRERMGGFGAEGVSRATTNAVVFSSVSILVWDYLIGALMI
ncbi:ABC transporter permease, partial [bacterium]